METDVVEGSKDRECKEGSKIMTMVKGKNQIKKKKKK